ncbi:MAG: hypothetical protein R3D32_08790 [Nitratireductor sp.]
MDHPAQRYVRILERGLQKTDALNDVNRKQVYHEARAALARVAIDPAKQLENHEALEIAIDAVETAYRDALAEVANEASRQNLTAKEIPATAQATAKPGNADLQVPLNKVPRQGLLARLRLPTFVLGGLAFAGLLIWGLSDLLKPPLPVLFSQNPKDTVITVFGNGINPQFEAFNEVVVKQAEAGSDGKMTIRFSNPETSDLPLSFAFMALDPAYVKLLAGKEIELGIVARDISRLGSEHEKPGSLTLRYHSSLTELVEAPQQLERSYKDFYFKQKIPERSKTANADMLIIIPSRQWTGMSMEVSDIAIRIPRPE